MRDPDRIERIAAKLTRAWALYPDLRLGQLMHNLARPADDTFAIEDDELERRLDAFLSRPPYVNLGTDQRPLYAESQRRFGQDRHRVVREIQADLARDDADGQPDDPRQGT